MTNRDIFVQILSEASGRPIEAVKSMADAFFEIFPARGNLDQELSQAEAEQLLAKLRAELPGIRAWLVQGGYLAVLDRHKGTAH